MQHKLAMWKCQCSWQYFHKFEGHCSSPIWVNSYLKVFLFAVGKRAQHERSLCPMTVLPLMGARKCKCVTVGTTFSPTFLHLPFSKAARFSNYQREIYETKSRKSVLALLCPPDDLNIASLLLIVEERK